MFTKLYAPIFLSYFSILHKKYSHTFSAEVSFDCIFSISSIRLKSFIMVNNYKIKKIKLKNEKFLFHIFNFKHKTIIFIFKKIKEKTEKYTYFSVFYSKGKNYFTSFNLAAFPVKSLIKPI